MAGIYPIKSTNRQSSVAECVTFETYTLLHDAIADILPDPHHPLYREAEYHFKRNGKYLRGLSSLALSKNLAIPSKFALKWALAIELMHNASLIHDDICDQDSTRRGQTSVWREFGTNKSLCLGDWLVARSFQSALQALSESDSKSTASVQDLAQSMMTLCSGQAREFDRKPILDWFSYDRVVKEKTTPLLNAALFGPLYFSGQTDMIKPLASIVEQIGLAYQIANDLDNAKAEGSDDVYFTDLVRCSPNAVIVSYAETPTTPDKAKFIDWCLQGDMTDSNIWIERILNSKATERTTRRQKKLLNDIEVQLTTLPEQITQSLTPIISYLKTTDVK